MRKATALAAVLIASGMLIAACAKSSQTSTATSATSEATAAATEAATTGAMTTTMSKLPIPPSKMPTLKVPAGSAAAGASVFAANCESCHGAKGIGGGVGPRLVASGLSAGQVAYMVRNPQGVDKQSAMPKLTLTDKQVADVAAYVASLK